MRIGLFPGSFNPIHIGHLVIAGYLAEFCGLDEVWIIVSPHNPLKQQQDMLQDYQRLELVKLAVGHHKKIRVSDVEFKLPRPNYTIQTIRHLKEKFPEHEFILVTGEDILPHFDQWKDHEEILQECLLYVYPRLKTEKTKWHVHPKVKLLKEVPVMEISATFIRQSIRNKIDVRYMLPESVWNQIEDSGFYSK